MKKLFYILILFLLLFPFACRYKDGPAISFRSVDKRIEGTWQIVGFTSNGVDSLQYCIDNCGNGMGIPKINPHSPPNLLEFTNKYFCATWTFSDNKTIMDVSFSPDSVYYSHSTGAGPIKGGYINEEWKILKLEMNELKISTDYNDRTYIMSFKK